jgi:chemotaxis protein methyltransferase CheR
MENKKEFLIAMPEMTDQTFACFSRLIYDECGIQLPPSKKTMLKTRLNKRLKAKNIKNFYKYYQYVRDENNIDEKIMMLDVVSTNKTEFFRERMHFNILRERIFPEFMERADKQSRTIKIWSAGCSSGPEPYSIAMTAAEYFRHKALYDFQIKATDLSTQILKRAVTAVYTKEELRTVSPEYTKKYFMHGKGRMKNLFKVVPEIRKKIEFYRLNLMDRVFDIEDQDIIFCRNVIIYFDKETQKALFEKFYRRLKKGGYLFLGHSETMHGISKKFRLVGPTTYVKN